MKWEMSSPGSRWLSRDEKKCHNSQTKPHLINDFYHFSLMFSFIFKGWNLKKDYGDNDAFIRLILWHFPPLAINFHPYHHCLSNLPQVTTSCIWWTTAKVLKKLCMHIWDLKITRQQFNRHAVYSSNREMGHKKVL